MLIAFCVIMHNSIIAQNHRNESFCFVIITINDDAIIEENADSNNLQLFYSK